MIVVSPFTGTPREWNDFVSRQEGWTHFHKIEWREVIERTFAHECLSLAAYEDGVLAGVLPLVRVRSLLFGHYLVSMPFLNYGGPLGTPDAIRAMVQEVSALAVSDRVKLLELRSATKLPITLEASHRKLTVLLDLEPGNPDALWRRFPPKLRTQVRRSGKEGVTVRFGAEQLPHFFAVFSEHMRELGTPTLPLRFFQQIVRLFPESCWVACAYHEGVPVAGGCGFHWGNEFEITWSSTLARYRSVRVNELLFWSFIERAAAHGCSVFNFGRSSPGSGTHEFKHKWTGARDAPLWWYDLAASPGAKTPAPTDAAYSWGPKVWKRLPTSLATTLGPRIVRFLP